MLVVIDKLVRVLNMEDGLLPGYHCVDGLFMNSDH